MANQWYQYKVPGDDRIAYLVISSDKSDEVMVQQYTTQSGVVRIMKAANAGEADKIITGRGYKKVNESPIGDPSKRKWRIQY